MAETFATLIAELRVEDEEFKRDLKRDESVIARSADRMKSSLSRVAIANQKVAVTSFNASRGLNAFSASAGALGGTLGTVVSQAAATVGTVTLLGEAFGGISTALLGGVGAILALVSLREELTKGALHLTKWLGLIDRIPSAIEKVTGALSKEQAFFGQLQALRESVAVQEGVISPEEARFLQLRRQFGNVDSSQISAQLSLEAQKTANNVATQVTKAEEAATKATADRVQTLRNETDLLLGRVRAVDLIADAEERRAFTERRRAKEFVEQDKRDRARILGDLAGFRDEEQVQRATTRGVAQALAIQAGINQPSDFVSDPTQRNLTRLMERLSSAGGGSGGISGTIGSRAALSISDRNLSLNPQFGSQKVSSEKKQDVANKLLREIKQALSTLNTGAV